MDKGKNNRRQFLTNLGLGIAAITCNKLDINSDSSSYPLKNKSWHFIRKQFPISKNKTIQLNSGSAGVMPKSVLKALLHNIELMNSMAPYEAWKLWAAQKKLNLINIADSLEVSWEELSIVRNTTEALNNIIFGLTLQKGDEIIVAKHDYPFVHNAVKQRERRDGVVVKTLDVPLPFVTDQTIVETYAKAISPQTKVMIITYITHRIGHIMPVKKLIAMAHAKGVEVILDAAHAYGQIKHSIKDLDCDYYASSLHKWLCAPHGTGVLFIKKEKIKKIYPLLSADVSVDDTMVKFEYLGTRAFHQEIGIGKALEFLNDIGLERKQAYLHELKLYWTEAIRKLPNVKLCTDTSPEKSCAVATFAIEKKSTWKVKNKLENDYNIHAKSVGLPNGSGAIRVSVNVFNTKKELDQLVKAISTISKEA